MLNTYSKISGTISRGVDVGSFARWSLSDTKIVQK